VRARHTGDRLRIDPVDPGDEGGNRDAFAVTVVRDGDARFVFGDGLRVRLAFVDPLAQPHDEAEHGGHLTAPMSGTIVAVTVKAGDVVDKGAPLVVLEAMKMEHAIVAPVAGRVAAVHFGVGDRVTEGADVVELDERVADGGDASPGKRAGSRTRARG